MKWLALFIIDRDPSQIETELNEIEVRKEPTAHSQSKVDSVSLNAKHETHESQTFTILLHNPTRWMKEIEKKIIE